MPLFNPFMNLASKSVKSSTLLGEGLRITRRHYHKFRNGKARSNNIAMLHAGRCGSTVLANLLNQRPDVHWSYEPFESMLPAYYAMPGSRRAHHVLSNAMYRSSTPTWGFDAKYLPEQHLSANLANMSGQRFVELLHTLGITHFVLLQRKNHLRRATSIMVGTKTGQWVNKSSSQELVKIRLDPQRMISYGQSMPLLDFFQRIDEHHNHIRKLLPDSVRLDLSYEDDIETDPLQGYLKLERFLHLEPFQPQVKLRKMNPYPLSEIIENYSDIVDVLSGTPHAWMLES